MPRYSSDGLVYNSHMTAILNDDAYGWEPETFNYIQGIDAHEITDVRVLTVFGEQYLRPLFVIVEGYDHKKYGRGKRRWLSEFTPAERKTVSNWYLRIYAWYLRTGIPYTGVRMSAQTYQTLRKAADFFATI